VSAQAAVGSAALVGALASVALASLALMTARVFHRAAVRYRVLTVAFGLVVLLVPSAWLTSLLRPPATGRAPGESVFGAVGAPLVGAALLIAVLLLLELGVDIVRLRRIKHRAIPVGLVAVRGASIGISPRVGSPTAIGYLHPAIVVPDGFRDRVDAAEWRAVLDHECAHLRRYDDWAKAVQSTLQRVAWWLPGLWILGRALDLEREMASDDHAVLSAGSRRYAACLVRLASSRGGESTAPALWGRRSHVALRVERLLRPTAAASLPGRIAGLAASAGLACAIVAGALAVVPPARSLPVRATACRAPVRHAPTRRPVIVLAARAARPSTVRVARPHAVVRPVVAAVTEPVAVRVHVRLSPPRPAAPAHGATAPAAVPVAPAQVAYAAPSPSPRAARTPAARSTAAAAVTVGIPASATDSSSANPDDENAPTPAAPTDVHAGLRWMRAPHSPLP
jgi:Zn-dependent protease with chaperone function